jgi:hypothetical protein
MQEVAAVQIQYLARSLQQVAGAVLPLLAQASTAVQAAVAQTLLVQPQKEQAFQDKDLMAVAATQCSVRLVPAVDQAVQAVHRQAVQ